MSKALKKLTLAYLALQERAEKLEKDKDALFIENQSLLHKVKTTKENNRFLQSERDKLQEDKEDYFCAHADEVRNLKDYIDTLEAQLFTLANGHGYENENEKPVCRADFKASETKATKNKLRPTPTDI